ncbi:MAG TPA: DUF3159 domain-containing protein [Marmoricola sp.]
MSEPTVRTVEAMVRHRLAEALGGTRGVLEAAIPTAVFTVVFLVGHHLRLAIEISVACAVVFLLVRLVQRSTPQFALNALVGIAIGSLFAWRAARGGGDAGDQALAYFLPGLLYNAGYTVFLALSAIVGWPLVGFLVGSVTGDPTAWHSDRAIVRLCSQLTWILALPCLIRVVVQGPVYLAGHQGWWATDTAVGVLGGAKLAMGWPLQVAAFAAMAWLLGRNHTPLEGEGSPDAG